MIRVELPVLVFIYLIVFLAAVFSLWIVYEWLRRSREKEALRYRVDAPFVRLFSKTKPITCFHDALAAAV